MIELEGKLDGFANMERDAALLEACLVSGWAARVYEWEGPWVSLGFSQDPARDLLPDAPVRFVRRPTGGRAVLHGHDVTIGLAASLEYLDLDERSLRPIYRRMVEPLIAALQACGAPAALGENTRFASRTPRSADCFAHVAANDIVHKLTGAKVCGCALKVTEQAALIQASIPAALPLVDPALVFREPAANSNWVEIQASQLVECLGKILLVSGRSVIFQLKDGLYGSRAPKSR